MIEVRLLWACLYATLYPLSKPILLSLSLHPEGQPVDSYTLPDPRSSLPQVPMIQKPPGHLLHHRAILCSHCPITQTVSLVEVISGFLSRLPCYVLYTLSIGSNPTRFTPEPYHTPLTPGN